MKVLVVIVNYRTSRLVVDCLRSLEAEKKQAPDMTVSVVDSNSRDDSVPVISRAISENNWRQWVTLTPLECNAGFAGGNNAAISLAMQSLSPPDYVMLLNPDTIVQPGAVGALLNFLEERPEAGIAGSRLEDTDGRVQVSAFRFPSIASEIDGALRFGVASRLLRRWQISPPPPESAAPADWLSGAALMVRASVIEQAGMLDGGYFMYYEDIDFCRGAQTFGWSCWYVPESRVVHLVSQSSGIENAAKPRPHYWFDARRRYFLKNHGFLYAGLCDAAWIAGFALWRARRRVLRMPDTDPPNLLRDFISRSVFARGRTLPEPVEDTPPPGNGHDDSNRPPNVLPFSCRRRRLP